MKTINAFFAVFALVVGASAYASTVAEDTLSMLQTMKSVYSAEYAPADWKMKFANWDLNNEIAKATAEVQSRPNMTLQESRDILKNFIYSMRDYHVSIRFTSTESASLPIVVAGTDTQEFIVFIDRSKLSETAFPFNVGDELVAIDGTPVMTAVADLQAQFTENVKGTDKRQAEQRLFNRTAARGLRVPKGPVTLTIRPKGQTETQTVQLIWDYKPERINPRSTFSKKFTKPSLVKGMMLAGDFDVNQPAASPFDVGARKTFTPDLGTKIWESDAKSTFYAYIFQNTDKKLVGYVRIPSYIPDGEDFKKAVADFKEIVARFEASTDSMVIDQVNNPGGSVFYLYTLASMVANKPLVAPRHLMAVDQALVKQNLDVLDQLQSIQTEEDVTKAVGSEDWANGYPITLQFVNFMRSFANFIVDEWNAGKKLTSAYWIDGVDHINPAATHYTKPILLLINELDFSGGDFFPTILQDNARVKIMGARTAGAGGYVLDQQIQNNLGVERFRVTESIAERVSGNPIENLGVTPEIPYTMTADDYQSNFAPYVKAIQQAVSDLSR